MPSVTIGSVSVSTCSHSINSISAVGSKLVAITKADEIEPFEAITPNSCLAHSSGVSSAPDPKVAPLVKPSSVIQELRCSVHGDTVSLGSSEAVEGEATWSTL